MGQAHKLSLPATNAANAGTANTPFLTMTSTVAPRPEPIPALALIHSQCVPIVVRQAFTRAPDEWFL